jgi:hypothetical protein
MPQLQILEEVGNEKRKRKKKRKMVLCWNKKSVDFRLIKMMSKG